MRGSEPRMNTAIDFVERLEWFLGSGPRVFHPSSGAWLGPPSNDSTFYHQLAAEINAIGRKPASIGVRLTLSPSESHPLVELSKISGARPRISLQCKPTGR